MRKTLFAAAVIAALAASGCTTDDDSAVGGPSTSGPATGQPLADGSDVLGDTSFLAPFGLEASGTEEIVDALDRTNADREAGLAASVRYDTVIFATPDGEAQLALPDDLFYLSLAPYVASTHECYYHNLASCQGELVGEDIEVTITAADGEVLVDETATTYENGFVGFWLPRDIEGTISVAWDGLTTTAPIATGPDDPTCVTTLQLS